MTSRFLARFLARAADDRPAIVEASAVHSYSSVVARARSAANVILDGRASLDGERVALLVSPGAAFIEAFFSVLLAGGCVVVLSPLHPEPETAYLCDDAGVIAIVASPDLQERASRIPGGRRLLSTTELTTKTPNDPRALPDAHAAALQLYTSGTTGKPKGAVLTHENLVTQQELLGEAWGFSEADVLLHTLPLHHMHGLAIALMTALGSGAAVRMLPQFDALGIWEAMAESTVFMAVPTMYAKLLAAFDSASEEQRARFTANARALRLATSGSAALPVSLAERWRAITGSIPLERFGMTEIGVGLMNPLHGERRAGSVGLPLRTVETRIVGDDGAPAEKGELWIAGPSVFSHYHRKESATAEAFVELDGTRFFKTGDTVERAPDGYVRILGRTSVDILKSGGYKLSALEIEEVLRESPAVAEVAVVGVPDETWGDRVTACIVPRSGQAAACAEEVLRAFAKEKLAPYKVPRSVILFDELPRNAIGKVVKPELVRILRARGDG